MTLDILLFTALDAIISFAGAAVVQWNYENAGNVMLYLFCSDCDAVYQWHDCGFCFRSDNDCIQDSGILKYEERGKQSCLECNTVRRCDICGQDMRVRKNGPGF